MTNIRNHEPQLDQLTELNPDSTIVLIDARDGTLQVRGDETVGEYDIKYANRRVEHVGAVLAGIITVTEPGEITSHEVSDAMDRTVRLGGASISKTIAHLRKDGDSPLGELPGVVKALKDTDETDNKHSTRGYRMLVGDYVIASTIHRPRRASRMRHSDDAPIPVLATRTLPVLPSEQNGIDSLANQFMWGRGGYTPGEK